MSDVARYSAIERLRDGRPVEIRALRPDDRADLIAAVSRTSAESFYRRFFGVRHEFTEKEIAFFLNIDFINHVALIVIVEEGGQPTIVGGGRYIVAEPGTAEVAFAVIDAYQGHGIGAALLRHLTVIAGNAGLRELIADVLPDNTAMLKVFAKAVSKVSTKRGPGVVHVALRLV